MRRLAGPGQMAFVLGTPDSTTVLFDDFIDGNEEIFLVAD
jgi:Icc protein